MEPRVRATAILIENLRLLVVEQDVTESRRWSLPGGRLEAGETIAECLKREVAEETGLEVTVDRLLYVCERIDSGQHTVHMTFLVKRIGGTLALGREPESDANPIKSVRMVPIAELPSYGFSQEFASIVEEGFPDAGTYKGSVANIGL